MARFDVPKFYITTPIYYVTAKPHLGHLYSTLLADVFARWQRLQGKNVFFLTGTDEHGQKIAKAAAQAGKPPKEFVDSFIAAYQEVWKDFEVDYSLFMRTTDQYHVKAVQEWITRLIKKGDIYKAFYKGWYCIHCEMFVTEYDAAGQASPPCSSCGRPTELLSEETYFFKLSAYQEKLLALYEKHPDFILPKERAHEVINFVKAGLKDLSISRTTITWGIPFPDDSKHVTYVWADALNNYITGVGYGQPGKEKEFNYWWPADLQILGKDILRFHAIYWPAFLMASGLELPRHLLVHGWIKVGGQKMSKSLSNAVDPVDLYKTYGPDPIRYYFMRQLAVTHDGEFSIEDVEQKIASDLADDLGNLLNRMSTLALKHSKHAIELPKTWTLSRSQELENALHAMIEEYHGQMNNYMAHMALARVWKFIHEVNVYFHESEPWKLIKENPALFAEVIAATTRSLHAIALILWPVMPAKMEELLRSIGAPLNVDDTKTINYLDRAQWGKKYMIQKIDPLFVKPAPQEPTASAQIAKPALDTVTIDEFAKSYLAIGLIEHCETIEKSDKLLKLQVDFGDVGKRQILSGIRKFYKPEDLIGKQALFIVNLPPRMMMGMESQGMLLTAEKEDGSVAIITPTEAMKRGIKLK